MQSSTPTPSSDNPRLLAAADIQANIRRQLEPFALPPFLFGRAFEDALAPQVLLDLQVYWVDTQLRQRCPTPQDPEWAPQRARARLAAALGEQRHAGDPRKGLDHILPPGLGRDAHVRHAVQLDPPFSVNGVSDDDTRFAARAVGLLRPLMRAATATTRCPPMPSFAHSPRQGSICAASSWRRSVQSQRRRSRWSSQH